MNEVPAGQDLSIGSQSFDFSFTERRLREHVEPVEVASREEAERMVRDGDVLGALIVPSDTVQKLDSGLDPPELEVFVNEEDPLKARVVDDAIDAAIADANRRVSRALTRTSIELSEPAARRRGRERARARVHGARAAPDRRGDRGGAQAAAARLRGAAGARPGRALHRLAQENFGLSTRALTAISEPIRVDKRTSPARGCR